MNKVNNLGQSVFVNCMNCNNYLKKSKYCNELLTHITTSSFAENCNSFDCDKILSEETRKEYEKKCDCSHTQACSLCAERKDIDWTLIEG